MNVAELKNSAEPTRMPTILPYFEINTDVQGCLELIEDINMTTQTKITGVQSYLYAYGFQPFWFHGIHVRVAL